MAFELPKLKYAYDALEPHIDARTMEKASSGRVQEKLLAQQLDDFRGCRPREERRACSVARYSSSAWRVCSASIVRSGAVSVRGVSALTAAFLRTVFLVVGIAHIHVSFH